MPDTLLALNGLDAHYGDFQALFGVDMEVHAGEVISIIGANGAGKTTLMRSITGLMRNTAEQINHLGQPIGRLRADQVAHRGIAMVPEGRQLFPSLSIEENLLVGGKVGRTGPWSLSKVYDMFPILAERKGQKSMSLSGGQQQMVAIGRALMANPDLILFDEISLGLAPVVISDIYKALPDIIGEGMTAMLVEQDISRALQVSSRVYCLQEGRVSLEGRTGDVSRDDITAAYFGVTT
ncbi:amino acid/amide ABC transporter ATP-binding protein 2 (HAAT family) [Yoonia maricola]|uniref:Amino acid/amide ABC transporter ATP-binding protein 2 (HAAT family) n=1 Tax=Yoonia maricola TaxID=420999 RepID=A0A2M8W5G7_9RHOB|nr:ABC transporter ATP-binding protein [Yoonia maricola]PJI86175.1 amino acid/amide ABC transporter ATP-binding protein 2 (HAAT family) [Yoonia maricola]